MGSRGHDLDLAGSEPPVRPETSIDVAGTAGVDKVSLGTTLLENDWVPINQLEFKSQRDRDPFGIVETGVGKTELDLRDLASRDRRTLAECLLTETEAAAGFEAETRERGPDLTGCSKGFGRHRAIEASSPYAELCPLLGSTTNRIDMNAS